MNIAVAHLYRAFTAALLTGSPDSILDIGCRRGALLEHLQAVGITGCGLEIDPGLVAEARAAGHDVIEGDAGALPFAAGSFDWAAIRHVLHHLEDPGAAVCEAFRVARSGVVLAEPWYDREFPSQRLAARFDSWTKALDRRFGELHEDCLAATEMIALLPDPENLAIDIARFRKHVLYGPGQLADEAEPYLARLADGDPARDEYAEIAEAARSQPLSRAGSLILSCRRAESEEVQ